MRNLIFISAFILLSAVPILGSYVSTGGGSGTNVGSGAGLIYKDNTGGTINFKTIKAGGGITVTNNTSDVTLSAAGAGLGNVVGPASATVGHIATYLTTDGATIQDQSFSAGVAKFLTDGTITSVTPIAAADLPNPGAAAKGGIFSKASVSHNFLTQLGTDGSVAQAQPAFTDISGSVASTQMPALTSDVTTSAGAVATTVAKIQGTTVSGTTGTGNVAFSTSPNFSTQLTFGNYHLEPCENDSGNSGTTKTLDLSTCAIQKSTLTGNVTYTLSNPVTGGSYIVRIVQGASSYTVTWPAAVKWSGGTAPVITVTNGKIDVINILYDGTNYYGTYSQNY